MNFVFFSLLIVGLLFESQVFCATISKINQAKKLVTVNEGSDTGFVKKARVCFYEGATKIGCAFVKASKNNIASIKPKDKLLAKLKEGLEVRLEPLPTAGLATSTEPEVAGASSFASYLRVGASFPVANAVTYSNLLYETPLSADIESMWTRDSTIKNLGVNVEVGIALSNSLLAFGARSRMFIPKKIASDYEDKDKDGYFERYAETVGRGKSMGVYLDYYYLNFPFGVVSFNLGNGLDFDQSTITLTMDQREDGLDETNQLFSATSKLTASFLRTNLLLDFDFGSLGFHFGSTIYVPITQKNSFVLSYSDPFTDSSLKNITAEEDLKAKLGHQAKVGADLFLATYYSF